MKLSKRPHPKVYTISSLVITILLGSMLYINSQASLPTYDSQGQSLPTLAPMLEKITDGVVNVSTLAVNKVVKHDRNGLFDQPFFNQPLFQDPLLNRFLEQFKQYEQQEDSPNNIPNKKQTNLGSGVIINAEKGYVLTNNHVIEHADKILITLRFQTNLQDELLSIPYAFQMKTYCFRYSRL